MAVDNACNLYESAERTAKRGNFGHATALTVLAIEEAAKGRALFGYALSQEAGRSFPLGNRVFAELLFYNHPLRHIMAALQARSRVIGEALATGKVPGDPQKQEQLKADLQAAKWLMRANRLKKSGLYVDFRNGKWHTPTTTRPEVWSESQSIAEPSPAEGRRQAAIFRQRGD